MTFMKYFELICKDNEMWGKIAEQVLLGQINPINYIDNDGTSIKPKISPTLIDISSIGQDTTLDATFKIAKKFGLKCMKIGESQEAGLTATRVDKGNIKGVLETNDILGFPEASSLFNVSQHKLGLINALQMAIEKQGYVSKIVGGEHIEYKTNVSLFLLTTPFDKLKQSFLEKGLFQRCIVSRMDRRIKDVKGMMKRKVNEQIGEEEISIVMDTAVSKLKISIEKAKMNHKERTVMIDKNIQNKMLKKVNDYYDLKEKEINNKNFRYRIFPGYYMRSFENLNIMAVNMMFRDNKLKVDEECYTEPFEIYKHHIDSIVDIFNNERIEKTRMMGEGNKTKYNHDEIKQIIEDNKGKIKEVIILKIMKKLTISRPTARNIYDEVKLNKDDIKCK